VKIIISGASGLIGKALTDDLRADGRSVARLVRPRGSVSPGDLPWDPAAGRIDAAALEGADAVVNLNGASIAGGRWTRAYKAQLRSSRLDPTRLLVTTFAKLQRKPRVFLSASAVGFYGSRGDEILSEASAPGTDSLALLASEWEAEATRAAQAGIRTVLLRFGVIVSGQGGALPRMLLPFRFGVGGRFGSGKQWMSWIALEDVIGIVRAAIEDERFAGPINLVAPNPVRNREFTQIVARTLHRPAIFPAPAFALRIALGEMADALLLVSQRAIPERVLAMNYPFRFAKLESALETIARH
jgi:uncharacterized protein